ncbi:MAG: glutathione S-transferase N-terminal domain-containing protein [Cryobacterium sp.]|nr:glutathione S-transferase N-terminal domain-containing protein [Oligoflexia bacterium]
MSPQVTVYTMDHCPYCERAKSLLKQRGVAYSEVKLPMDDDAAWANLEKKTGMKTMPQILNGEKVIGGYNDLAAIDQKDQLASLKA